MKRIIYTLCFCTFNFFGFTQTDNLEKFNLPLDTFNNGVSASGGFDLDYFFLPNYYTVDTTFGDYWSGFVLSTMRDDSTAGYLNQYSSITASGASSSATYAMAYPPYFGELQLVSNQLVPDASFVWNSVDITNSTYAYLSMLNGEAPGKKFGGSLGDDPDFLILHIIQVSGEVHLDTIDVYLADFTSNNNAEDYILDSWKTIDLLGFDTLAQDSATLQFSFSSTDTAGGFINTPTYFCMDNLSFSLVTGINEFNRASSLTLKNRGNALRVNSQTNGKLCFYNLNGTLVREQLLESGENEVYLDLRTKGHNIVVVENANESESFKLYFQ